MKTTANSFELLAFEASVREHLGSDAAALALVDYLIEHGASAIAARRRVLRLRREECFRRHLRQLREEMEGNVELHRRIHRAVNAALRAQVPTFADIQIVEGGMSPLISEIREGYYDRFGNRYDLVSRDEQDAGDIRYVVARNVIRVGATWIVRALRLGYLDVG